jgi:hypothetical protein
MNNAVSCFASPIHDEMTEIWPTDVEQAFQDAFRLYPSSGRSKIKGSDGKLYGASD